MTIENKYILSQIFAIEKDHIHELLVFDESS